MKKNFMMKLSSSVLAGAMAVTTIFMPVKASILSESNTENTSVQEPGTLPVPEEITLPGTENTPTDSSGGIVPYWGTSDHVNKQCEYVISQLGLSSSQAAWLKDGCGCVDGKFSNIRGFHAKKKTNYLACIKALFMFGQLVGKNDTGLTKKEVVFQAMPKLDDIAKKDIVDMFDSINNYFESKGSTSKEQRRYIAYGFGLHLLGDMYAHRILVKVTNLNKLNTPDSSTNKYLQPEDFPKINELKINIPKNEVTTAGLKDYMYPENPDPKKSHVYTTNYPKEGTKVTKRSKVYPDNPYFMPKRFNAAKQASVSFIKQIRTNSNFNTVNFYLGNYNLNFDKFNEFQAIIS